MKIALVYPRYRYPSGDPPLGLAALAGVLWKEGVEPDILDPTFERRPRSWLLDRLAERPYDIVGFSAMVTQIRDALEAAAMVKYFYPDTKTLVGGPHATVVPEAIIGRDAVDAICVGEGESAMRAIAAGGGDFADAPGIWHKRNGEIIRNHPAPPEDLDELPHPDFSGLPMESYFANWFQLDSVSGGLKGLPIIASRGCPYRCSYCQPTLDRLFGKKIRKRSPESIVEELKAHKERYGINAFLFVDDTFVADRNWAMRVCSAIEEARMGFVWGANVRADLVDRELLAAMKNAGLAKLFVGIESGSERALTEIYHKGINLDQVRDTVYWAKELGIMTQGYFMMGAPTETPGEIGKTVRLARNLPLDDAVFNIVTPLPGTKLRDMFSERIAEPIENLDYYKVYPWKGGRGVTAGKLKRWRRMAYLSFYLHPRRASAMLLKMAAPGGIRRAWLKLKRI